MDANLLIIDVGKGREGYDREGKKKLGLPLCRQIKTSYFVLRNRMGSRELDCRKEAGEVAAFQDIHNTAEA